MAIKLTADSIQNLSTNVAVPVYNPKDITPGILHLGVGNFHRAHQAVYLDKLFNLGLDHDWGIVGAGIKSFDATMRTALQQQDWLTTVVEVDQHGANARISASMIDFIEINSASILNILDNPSIRIVSLTITEGGYFIDAQTGGFQVEHPEVQFDIKNPETPSTVFGIIVAALKSRKEKEQPPFTIMSCDNVPHNGEIAKLAVLGLAEKIDPELARWIEGNVGFPNSMVDCITPATSVLEKNRLLNDFDIDDKAPVFCEPFRQWVIEDNFPQGRPALEKVGVEFVEDVTSFEFMKLRILNGGHMALAFPAALLNIIFVHEAVNNPLILQYLKKLISNEAIPSLKAIPDVDFNEYLDLIIQRFSNPEVRDTVARLCVDSSNRLPKFILPIIKDNLEANRSIEGLSLVIAFWCLFCSQTSHESNNHTLVDEKAELLSDASKKAHIIPSEFLKMEEIFGSLSNDSVFIDSFTQAYKQLQSVGVEECLRRYVNSSQ